MSDSPRIYTLELTHILDGAGLDLDVFYPYGIASIRPFNFYVGSPFLNSRALFVNVNIRERQFKIDQQQGRIKTRMICRGANFQKDTLNYEN